MFTNEAKRSFRSRNLKELRPDLFHGFLRYVDEQLGIKIFDSNLQFFKRKNSVFNPHIDPDCCLQILIYLNGEIYNLDNGTFFMDNENIILQTANIPNSAVVFDSSILHGSIQSLANEKDRGWRYSLNCFIYDYK